jgi:hypothetical protein
LLSSTKAEGDAANNTEESAAAVTLLPNLDHPVLHDLELDFR